MDHLKAITRDNKCCDFLGLYLQNPAFIDGISMKIVMVNKDLLSNLPIILNDLRDYLVSRQDQVLDAQASHFKTSVVSLQCASTDFKTDFISKNWAKVAKKEVQVPEVVKELKQQDIQQMFPLIDHNRLLAEIEEMDQGRLKLTHISDYWKTRIRHTAQYLEDLKQPLPEGKFGVKLIPPKIKKMLADNSHEKIPFVRVSLKDR